ncbi:aspartate kinase [Peptacetobacter hominis]|uniref:Aspartokinase n=1 Tax=Peptacetobacter hominis TaxID=2743610 RepID=A0A544QU07_9FIRM|nr:aspartate kinase [Peptacetobacter hominis]TQQ84157.1 aspartate kinase [Peptacetobacter hominis]
MNILVQKFGGTSVANFERMAEVCDIVEKYKNDGYSIVLVVSAMGRKGAPYATDTLLGLLSEVNKNANEREKDMLMSCGETISATLMASMLSARGINAVALTGGQAGICTEGDFSDSRIKEIDSKRIISELEAGKVVVVAGFQGVNENGDITTLGRGGSDTSAVALGKALECGKVEIYTDVDGVMTADPRVEPNARVMEEIDYEEVFQMADKGAKVIHPRAVQIAKDGNITLVIKNTLNPMYRGTEICCVNSDNGKIECSGKSERFAVAHKKGISQIKIIDNGDFGKILSEMEEENVSMDMINFFIGEKAFVVDDTDAEKIEKILKRNNVQYSIRKNCAKITLIGNSMSGIPGVMSKISKGLSDAEVPILQTSDSSMTISCLVDEQDMENAVHAIHEQFCV